MPRLVIGELEIQLGLMLVRGGNQLVCRCFQLRLLQMEAVIPVVRFEVWQGKGVCDVIWVEKKCFSNL